MIPPGAASALLRQLAAAPPPGDWYAIAEKHLGFSRKSGKRPFFLCCPRTGPIATGYVRTRDVRDAVVVGSLEGSGANWCMTPRGRGLLHPAHDARHAATCRLTEPGLVPLWHIASVDANVVNATTRRCREPDVAVVDALATHFVRPS